MSGPFSDRPFPGDPVWLLHRFPGAWQDFEADPPWTDRVQLRVRSLYSARSVQLAGHIFGELPTDEVSLGTLSLAFWPAEPQRFILSITGGSYNRQGDLSIAPSGAVVLRPRVPLNDIAFRIVYPIA